MSNTKTRSQFDLGDFKWSFLNFSFSEIWNFWLKQTWRFLHQILQISNTVKQENFDHNNPQTFSFKPFKFCVQSIQNFDCKKPQRFSGKLWISLQMKIWKVCQRISEVCCNQKSWETVHTPYFTGRYPWNSFIPSIWVFAYFYCF